jgi:hypothetical protein
MKASTRKQLNVRSDEAYERAHRLAKHLGMTTQDVVVKALRALDGEDESATNLPSETIAQTRAIIRDAVDKLWGGKTPTPWNQKDDDDWMYDEFGLPK